MPDSDLHDLLKRRFTRKGFLAASTLGIAALAGGSAMAAADTSGPRTAATGWLSGAGDDHHSNNAGGGFGSWRGTPITFATIWTYASGWTTHDQVAVTLFTDAGYNQTLNLAIPWPDGTSWSQAASGGLDAYFHDIAETVVEDWGSLGCVHLSFAYEFNGTWMPWSVNGQLTAFGNAYRRYANIIRQNTGGRNVKIVLPFAAGTQSGAGATVQQLVSAVGTDNFDILGVDYYSAWPDLTNETLWDQVYLAEQHGPRGLGAWQAYAQSIGKPFSLPEWGLSDRRDLPPSDNPFFIGKMHEYFNTFAPADPNNPGPGRIAGEAYFNTWEECRLWPETAVPNAAAKYRQLF